MRTKGELTPVSLSKLEVWKDGNVRKHEIFDGIEELAKNISSIGLQVPLVVWYDKNKKKYKIISGQRRWLACRMVSYDPVECLVIDKPSVEKARILSLSENLYRRSMTPDDISDTCEYLYNRKKNVKDVAKALGVSTSTVRKYLGYQKVPEEIKKLVRAKKITASQALRVYTQFPDKNKQLKIAREIARISDRVEKSKYYEAVKDSSPGESSTKLRARAKKKRASERYVILIPPKSSEIVKKVAKEMEVEKEFVIVEIIERWVLDHLRTGKRLDE